VAEKIDHVKGNWLCELFWKA